MANTRGRGGDVLDLECAAFGARDHSYGFHRISLVWNVKLDGGVRDLSQTGSTRCSLAVEINNVDNNKRNVYSPFQQWPGVVGIGRGSRPEESSQLVVTRTGRRS
ncbi:hypothetical protein CO2235_140068 [Cupriavidus oxalaticus]|uniref:Uncharacterized protein n=1 Tax=Cupriavidus oxalaticus TaxID=96344 RepID=A0A375G0K8_9BURK|nr:hypothetical protein CO2235_140068 [Cupriavidus oxalaticus]